LNNAIDSGPGTINLTAIHGELSVVNSQSPSGMTNNDNTFGDGVVINTPTTSDATVNLASGYVSSLGLSGDTTFDNGRINAGSIRASDDYVHNNGTQSVLTFGPSAIVNLNQSSLFGDSNAGDGIVTLKLIAAGLAGGTRSWACPIEAIGQHGPMRLRLLNLARIPGLSRSSPAVRPRASPTSWPHPAPAVRRSPGTAEPYRNPE
jgi:hypothetical protein